MGGKKKNRNSLYRRCVINLSKENIVGVNRTGRRGGGGDTITFGQNNSEREKAKNFGIRMDGSVLPFPNDRRS